MLNESERFEQINNILNAGRITESFEKRFPRMSDVVGKYLKDNKSNSLHFASKMHGYLPLQLDITLFLEDHSLARASLSTVSRKTVRFSEKIKSADKLNIRAYFRAKRRLLFINRKSAHLIVVCVENDHEISVILVNFIL